MYVVEGNGYTTRINIPPLTLSSFIIITDLSKYCLQANPLVENKIFCPKNNAQHSSYFLMAKMPHPRKTHRYTMLFCRANHFLITH